MNYVDFSCSSLPAGNQLILFLLPVMLPPVVYFFLPLSSIGNDFSSMHDFRKKKGRKNGETKGQEKPSLCIVCIGTFQSSGPRHRRRRLCFGQKVVLLLIPIQSFLSNQLCMALFPPFIFSLTILRIFFNNSNFLFRPSNSIVFSSCHFCLFR